MAYTCTFCNRAKGTDIGAFAASTGEVTRFYNPRLDHWSDHFSLNGVVLEPRTAIGEATAKILRFNDADRIFERQTLEIVDGYPPAEAADLLKIH